MSKRVYLLLLCSVTRAPGRPYLLFVAFMSRQTLVLANSVDSSCCLSPRPCRDVLACWNDSIFEASLSANGMDMERLPIHVARFFRRSSHNQLRLVGHPSVRLRASLLVEGADSPRSRHYSSGGIWRSYQSVLSTSSLSLNSFSYIRE